VTGLRANHYNPNFFSRYASLMPLTHARNRCMTFQLVQHMSDVLNSLYAGEGRRRLSDLSLSGVMLHAT
jgi:hypothetical protein